jgi:hypothetical protein
MQVVASLIRAIAPSVKALPTPAGAYSLSYGTATVLGYGTLSANRSPKMFILLTLIRIPGALPMPFCRQLTALSIPPFLPKGLSLTSLSVVVGQAATTHTLVAPVPALSESLKGATTSVRTL